MATQLKPVEANSNMRLWDALGKTDPKHTKQFSRVGGFKGTAIKPQWVIQKLTELLGPCGIGWGVGAPTFQTVQAGNEVLVYCTVTCWHGNPANVLFGVGGDKVSTSRQSGTFNDDEAFKKAFTDAIMNAFKFIGVGADVHMGMFDDSKYVREVAAEYAEPKREVGCESAAPRKQPEKLTGPCMTRAEAKAKYDSFVRELHACADEDMLSALLEAEKPFLEQVKRELPMLLNGDGNDFLGLAKEVKRMRAEIEQGMAHEPENI